MYHSFFESYVSKIRASSGSSQAVGTCPFHDDKLASFSFNFVTGLWSCHAGCGVGNIITFARRLGVPAPTQGETFARKMETIHGGRSKPAGEPQSVVQNQKESDPDQRRTIARYIYEDESGRPLFRVCRTEPKGFYQQRYDDGKWVSGLADTRRVPYKLPELLAATQTVFFVEGEKDVERLRSLSLVATTSPMGASSWDTRFASFFKGKRVACIADNDEPGRSFISKVSSDLIAIQVPVKNIVLPGVPIKGDVSDFLDSNGDDVNALLDLVRSTPALDQNGRDKQPRQEPLDYFKSNGINLPPPGSLLPTEYAEFSHRAYSDVTSSIDKLTDEAMVVIEQLDGLWMKGVRTQTDYAVCLRLLMNLHMACL